MLKSWYLGTWYLGMGLLVPGPGTWAPGPLSLWYLGLHQGIGMISTVLAAGQYELTNYVTLDSDLTGHVIFDNDWTITVE